MLKLLKELLPDDICFRAERESECWRLLALGQSLQAMREEASDRVGALRAAGLEGAGHEGEEEEEMVTPTLGDPKLSLATDVTIQTLC